MSILLRRKVLFQIHSWVGVKFGVLFLVVCLSGTMATLSVELDWLFMPSYRATPVPEAKMVYAETLQKIKVQYPESQIIYWEAAYEPYVCDLVHLQIDGMRKYLFVNPYTGEIQGLINLSFKRFFRDLHYFLFIPFQIGHFTVLFFGFLLFAAIITALSFYKNWYRKFFEFKKGRSPISFFRSSHRLIGLWSLPFALVFSVTGIWYFIERTDIAGVGTISNPASPLLSIIDSVEHEVVYSSIDLDYDRAVLKAEEAIPGLKVKDILPPQNRTQAIYLTGKSNVSLVRHRANRIFIDPKTYEVISVQNAATIPTVMWINDIIDPLHFGTWGGICVKIIYFIGGFAITGLIYTGLKMYTRRNRQKLSTGTGFGAFFINLLLTAVTIGCMLYAMIVRYQTSWDICLWAIFLWGVIIVLSYYLFEKPQIENDKLALSSS